MTEPTQQHRWDETTFTDSSASLNARSWSESEYEQLSRLELCAQAAKRAPRRVASSGRPAVPDYKPLPLRWPFLVALITVLLALIAAVETACRLLPAEVDRDLVPGSEWKPSASTPAGRLMPRMTESGRSEENTSTNIGSDLTTSTSTSTPVSTSSSTSTPTSASASTSISTPASTPTSRSKPASAPTSTPTSASTPTSNPAPLLPTETFTKWLGPPTPSPSTATTTTTSTFSDIPLVGGEPLFGQPGYHTETITLDPSTNSPTTTTSEPIFFSPMPEEHGNEGPVTIESTVSTEIVSTILQTTTLPGAVTTVARTTTVPGGTTVVVVETTLSRTVASTFVGTSTVDGTPTTFVGTTWLGGGVSTLTRTETLSRVVSVVSEVRTLSGLVTAYPVTTTLRVGGEPSYVPAKVITLTGADGTPTATVTRTPPAVSTPTVLTLTDAAGAATATVTTSVLATPRTRVVTDSAGVATATVTEYPTLGSGIPEPQTVVKVYYISNAEYFVGFLLPTLLAVMLTIPVRMIDAAAKQLQPWHALTRHQGASAAESLCLRTGGLYGIVSSLRSLSGGQVLVFLTTLLTVASVVLVPLSVEAVSLKLHGSCSKMDFRGCAMTLGVFLGPARATIGVLGFMAVLVLLILVVLGRWKTGVAAYPWSIAVVASLASNPEVRAVFSSLPTGHGERITHRQLVAALDGKTFKLGYFFNRYGVSEYGLMVQDERSALLRVDSDSSASLKSARDALARGDGRKVERHLPFLMLSYTARIAFLVPVTGILALILYYNNTGGDTGFERFMSTQNFGVRALFTLVGIGICFFWGCFFTSLAVISPYQLLSRSAQCPQRSIAVSPPLDAFSGVVSAVRQRHMFLVTVAVTAVLAEFMPILLGNVPFRVTQTWTASRTCTWMAVGILSIMWLVVMGSFFVSWPHLPVDPSTIAGAMYYVCDSWMLQGLEGLSMLDKHERERRVAGLGLKFRFGDMVGVSGRRRIGVDGVDDFV